MNQYVGAKLAAIVALFCLFAFSAQAADERYLRITSGDVASGLFGLAGNVVNVVGNPRGYQPCQTQQPNCTEVGLIASAQVSPSAQAALSKLRNGVADVAIVPDSVAYAAYSGDAARRTRGWAQLRSLANLGIQPLIIFVRGDQEVLSMASLQGWRIAVGPRSSDINNSFTTLLGALGLTPNLYQQVYVDMNVSPYELITTGRADAVAVFTNTLAPAERNGLLSGALKIYGPGKLELERAVMAYPFIGRNVVDLGIGRNYTTLSSGSVLVARTDLPDAVVKTILARLLLKPQTGFNARQAALQLPVPLHSGAASFYQENKLLESDLAPR